MKFLFKFFLFTYYNTLRMRELQSLSFDFTINSSDFTINFFKSVKGMIFEVI